MYKNKILLVILILNIINLVLCLDPTQLGAISNINAAFNFGFDTSDTNVCTAQYNIKCDPTQTVITDLYFDSPLGQQTMSTSDLILFKNLTTLNLAEKIALDIQFWTDIQYLTVLSSLFIRKIYVIPNDIGVFFPPSLQECNLDKLDSALPETFFTSPRLKKIDIGSQNQGSTATTIPPSITEQSRLTQIRLGVSTGTIFSGESFPLVTSLTIYYYGSSEITFDSYDTYANLTYLFIQIASSVVPSNFPNSLLSTQKLVTLQLMGFDNVVRGTTTVLAFQSKYISNLSLYGIGFFTSLTYPGLTLPVEARNFGLISLYYSTIDLHLIDLSGMGNFNLNGMTIVGGGFPDQDYSKVFSISMIDSTIDNGVIPDSICRARKPLEAYNTTLTSIPQCLICDWGSVPVGLLGTGLVETVNCPDINVTSYSTAPTSPSGGTVTIFGDFLGWKTFDENNNLLGGYAIIGNNELLVSAPSGYGLNKSFNVKFHADVLPNSPVFTIYINYLPPFITTSSTTVDGTYNIYGMNLGNLSITYCTISGQPVTLSSVSFNSIATNPGFIPAKFRDVYSILLTYIIEVEGQSIMGVFGDASQVKIFQPLPVLYSGGGLIEFKGQSFSYDLSIMNLTVNGVPFRFLVNSSSGTSLFYEYDPIPKGDYLLVFNLHTYHFNDTISVSDIPCTVVHGYCLGNKPVCDSGYVGPDCSSIPANLTIPNYGQLIPNIYNDYTFAYSGNSYDFSYLVEVAEFREIDPTIGNQVVKRYTDFNFTRSVAGTNAYMYTFQLDNVSAILYGVTQWYPDAGYVYYLSSYENVVQSTTSFQVAVSNYKVLNPGNILEVDVKVRLELNKPNSNSCTSVSSVSNLQTDPDFDYLKIKIDHLDLFTGLLRSCYVDGGTKPCLPITVTPTNNTNNYRSENIFTVPFTSNFTSLYLRDLNFNVFYDLKSAKDEVNPICGKPTTPAPTSKTCKGSPQCYGNGVCNNGVCKCIADFEGEDCQNKKIVIPPATPNPKEPESNSTTDEVGIHVSVVAVKELDYNDNIIKTYNISSWTYSKVESLSQQSLYYKSILPNNSTIIVTIEYFYKDTIYTFGDEKSTKLKGSLKYSANITSWPFKSALNHLQVVFVTIVNDKEESTDSCTVKSIEKDEKSNINSISMQVNNKLFISKFRDDCIVDNVDTQVRNVLLPSPKADSNIETQSYVGIIVPHFNNYVLIDPDYSLLINYEPVEDKENSICSKKSSGLTKAQLAGIIVGSVVFAAAVTAIIVYAIKFNRDKKLLMKNLQNRLSNHNQK